ncbi:MAG TPA: hypothetical protein VGE55_04055 [Limnobacter sp.]|uniref:hypothetical protein n=1 Tax=Limnobacter sp. TaxID=2003368 RepID=UPI002EDA6F3D
MKPKHSHFSPLTSLLQNSETGSLIARAAQSSRLEKTIKGWPALRGVAFSVGPLKNDQLKLFVGTPAALTRLRQSLPSLITHLQQSGLNVNHIQLQIQTNPLVSKQLNRKPKRAVFTDAARKAWLDLENKLPDSPVKTATSALNRHHKFK